MRGRVYQSDFARLYVAEGHAEGFAEGFAQGFFEGLTEGLAEAGSVHRAGEWASALLQVLRIRGVAVPEAMRDYLLAKKDSGQLKSWLRKSLIPGPATAESTTSSSVEERPQSIPEEVPAKLSRAEIADLLTEELLEKGRHQGRLEGQARFFLLLLESKFGPLDPEVEDRVRSAEKDRLQEWGERLLTAKSLQDVFEG